MARPKVSQQNTVQTNTLLPPAGCLPDKRCRQPAIHQDVKACSSDRAAFFHCSMVYFWCSCSHSWTRVSAGTLTGLLLYRTSISFFSSLSYSSSSVRSNHTGQPSLPICISEPWPSTTLSPVQHCSFLGPLWIDHCSPGTPHESCIFGDVLTQSSNHHTVLHWPIFPPPNMSTLRIKC